jgi:endonuclease IV
MTLQVVTANRLDDGLAVFYTKDGQWSYSIDQAVTVNTDDSAEETLKNASNDDNQLIVVGPYLIDVNDEDGALVPARYREMIRTKGPSVRPDLGYQAQ